MSEALLSKRVQAVHPSPTMAFSARAAALKRAGRDIVSLSVGEPDFPVFPHVAAAVEEALRKGLTKYTPPGGVPELREAIADQIKKSVGAVYGPTQILATSGAKQALFNACQALLDDGDECIIPNPYWVSYPEMVRLSGGRPVELMLRAEDEWKPRPADVEALITPRTKLIMLGSPSNPTGAVWPAEALRGIAEVLRQHPRVVILSDDIYDTLTYGTPAPNFLSLAPDLAERTLLVNGVSKTYAMTGLRLGWAAGPQAMVTAMSKVQEASTSHASSLSQYAAIAALRGPQEPVEAMRKAFERRRDLMVRLVRALPGVSCPVPEGAFYVFPDVRKALGKLGTSQKLAEALLEQHGVATVPGSGFGREGYLRLSYATGEAQITDALGRVHAALAALQ